jgi:hypothetical protein
MKRQNMPLLYPIPEGTGKISAPKPFRVAITSSGTSLVTDNKGVGCEKEEKEKKT